MKRYVIMLLIVPCWLYAQDEQEERKLAASGYLKDMVTFQFFGSDSTYIDNLVHHRLNLVWYPSENLTAKLEFRNRLFTGDLVQALPNYDQLVDVNNDYLDLSVFPVNRRKVKLHSMIDRGFVQWNKNDWEVTLGRQRLNWGMNLVWNPNDLFNNYSFFDFDYEERPGSDALRVRRYTGYASEIEFAIAAAGSFEELTSAIKYQVNRWNYDIQFIGGVMQNNVALGTGWAGSIGGTGFKGEVTYLNSLSTTPNPNGLLASITIDYMSANSLYLHGSAIYNSFGTSDPVFGLVETTSNLDIRDVTPYEWSYFLQTTYPIHPLVNIGAASIWFPSDGSIFLNPSITYSVMENLDLDVIGQLYFDDPVDSKALFVRLKYSY